MIIPSSFRRAVLILLVCAGSVSAQEAAEPASASPSPTPKPPSAPQVENAVVKVFSTVRYPDPYRPWNKQAPRDVTGSGAILEGKRILTNAHVVLYASQIQVQANQAGDKLSATVEAVAPGIDLAVLKLEDNSFFDTHPALPLAKTLPDIKDAVLVYGYPQGGTSLSITKGIVSRIEFAAYNPPTSGLRIQIDAAINPGNSGGPAVVGDQMIGLAFSRLQGGSESIGYIIPAEEIELFLADIGDGKYDGKPALFDDFQTLENPALRAFLKLDKTVEGMVVRRPFVENDPAYPLKQWDVVTKVGDTPVDDQGMVKIGPNLRVFFAYLAQKQAREGKLPLTVVRASKPMEISLPVTAKRPLVIGDVDGGYPAYFVYGPLVFSEANSQFIGGLSGSGAGGGGRAGGSYLTGLAYAGSPLVTRLGDKPATEDERLVVVTSPFFPHKLAKGYGSAFTATVRCVNGKEIRNLKHLVEVLRDLKDEFVTFEFHGRTGESLVFPRAEVAAATEDILTDNGVRSQGSADLMKVWEKKGE